MTEYLVRWEIDQTASSPRDAAAEVRSRYFQLRGIASVFEVLDRNEPTESRWETVDLTYAENDRITWQYTPRALYLMAKQMVAQGSDLDEVLYMLEKPHKFPEVLTEAVLAAEYDKISDVPDTPDYSG